MLSSHPRLYLPHGLFLQDFRPNFLRISHIYHACYKPRSSHPPWLDHHNNIWWSVEFMKLHHYVVFSYFPPLHPSYVQIFSSEPYSLTSSIYVLPLVW
jgi:hypothetical protein